MNCKSFPSFAAKNQDSMNWIHVSRSGCSRYSDSLCTSSRTNSPNTSSSSSDSKSVYLLQTTSTGSRPTLLNTKQQVEEDQRSTTTIISLNYSIPGDKGTQRAVERQRPSKPPTNHGNTTIPKIQTTLKRPSGITKKTSKTCTCRADSESRGSEVKLSPKLRLS